MALQTLKESGSDLPPQHWTAPNRIPAQQGGREEGRREADQDSRGLLFHPQSRHQVVPGGKRRAQMGPESDLFREVALFFRGWVDATLAGDLEHFHMQVSPCDTRIFIH